MKKKIFFVLFFLTLSFPIFITYQKHSYSETYDYFEIEKKDNDSILQIGIIGDSWVSVFPLDSIVQSKLQDNEIHSKVMGASHPGATSKMIYENLFLPKSEKFSSKFIIENTPKYCIIIAGINDSFRGVGKDFYADHMLKIINTLLHYDITPIIFEIPNFGIEQSQRYRHKVSVYRDKLWFGIKNEDYKNLKEYRTLLKNKINEQKLSDKVFFITNDESNFDYHHNNNLYREALHLNKKGYDKLGDILTKKIIELENLK